MFEITVKFAGNQKAKLEIMPHALVGNEHIAILTYGSSGTVLRVKNLNLEQFTLDAVDMLNPLMGKLRILETKDD